MASYVSPQFKYMIFHIFICMQPIMLDWILKYRNCFISMQCGKCPTSFPGLFSDTFKGKALGTRLVSVWISMTKLLELAGIDINSLAWTSSLHNSHRSRGLVVSAVNLLFNHELILSGLESSDIKQISGTLGTDSLSATSDVSTVRLASGRWRSSLRCTEKSSWKMSQGNGTVSFIKTNENLWLSQLTSYRNQQSRSWTRENMKTIAKRMEKHEAQAKCEKFG